MTRVTGKSGYALVYVGENRVNEKGDAPGEMKPMAVLDVLAKLAEYESTGFEPKEIRERMRKRRLTDGDVMGLCEAEGMLKAMRYLTFCESPDEAKALSAVIDKIHEVLKYVR